MQVDPESVSVHGLDEDYLRGNGACRGGAHRLSNYMSDLRERYGRVRPTALAEQH